MDGYTPENPQQLLKESYDAGYAQAKKDILEWVKGQLKDDIDVEFVQVQNGARKAANITAGRIQAWKYMETYIKEATR